MSSGWEFQAASWAERARHPTETYFSYRDSFFDLLPPPGRATLEIGCGEGRVCRDLSERGHRMTGLDASQTLIAIASERDPAASYAVGTAEALPFADRSFDLVVAYNSLMNVDDMPCAVAEAARVLERGGRFCACVTHPVVESGDWTSKDDEGVLVVPGSYLVRKRFQGTFVREGIPICLDGWTYPVGEYTRALEDAGLLLEAIREPRAPAGSRHDARWQRFPMFLHLRAVRP